MDADLLRPTGVLLVEDDHAWGITTGPVESLGDLLPGRVVHIRGFSKSHGPDLRLAAIGRLARSHDLTAYDAAYLELALHRACPIVSLDESLRAAARKEHVEVLPARVAA